MPNVVYQCQIWVEGLSETKGRVKKVLINYIFLILKA